MPAIRWDVTILWMDGSYSQRTFGSAAEMKAWLDDEVFCLRHGCTLPRAVYVARR